MLAGMIGLAAGLWTWARPGDVTLYPARTDAPGVTVHILDNGFHTDLAVLRAPLEAAGGPLGEALGAVGPGDWILIGWGDARFYVDQTPMERRVPDGLRAFFGRGNPSVVMLNPHASDPAVAFDPAQRHTLRLSQAGFEAMRARVESSLDIRSGGPRLASARAGDDARFFASAEYFWIGYLCNHWTARVLNAAGLPIRPMRAATSGEVVRLVEAAKLDTAHRGA